MKYVYILESVKKPGYRYIGCTNNLKRRIQEHNRGDSITTQAHRPWRLETYVGFSSNNKAEKFEKYLKSGSGWAFGKKHF